MSRIFIVGSGGREHALAWKLSGEGHEVFVAPGNEGMDSVAYSIPTCVDPVVTATELSIDLAVIGPEKSLVDGLSDRFRAVRIPTVGPSAKASELEGSKVIAKEFMARHKIPTARSVVLRDKNEVVSALSGFEHPPVVKADGLAAGKGVVVASTFEEARVAAVDCLGGRFGSAGSRVLLEERLEGQEVSFFVLTDGTHAALFEPVMDHKRIGEGGTGPNTGGMGSFLPTPVFTEQVRAKTMERIVQPTLAGLVARKNPYVGVLFIGLMIDATGDPKVVEYNCRFGDPEVQSLMVGLQVDLYPRLYAAATGTLRDEHLPSVPSATVVLASAGYPIGAHEGDRIEGLVEASAVEGVQVFHAGTKLRNGQFETAGGRVLGMSAQADTLDAALRRAYMAVNLVHFPGMQVRSDIGRC